jgi:hypothetical protein
MEPLIFDSLLPVNKYLVPETFSGSCTAYVYTEKDDKDAGGRPALYSDNNNVPFLRKSLNEGFLDLHVSANKSAGWRAAPFQTNGTITSGSNLWFGVFTHFIWYPRFDYGERCYAHYWEDAVVLEDPNVPEVYPLYRADAYDDFKLSMYFMYTAPQQYVRTLTQGVYLADSLKTAASYRRTTTQTVKASTTLCGSRLFLRLLSETVQASETVLRGLLVFVRLVTTALVRDFIIRRFLKAQEQIVLKSKVCREIVLESKIH